MIDDVEDMIAQRVVARKIEVESVARESNGPVRRPEIFQAQNLRDVLQALYEGIPEHRIFIIEDELPPEGVPVNEETDEGKQEKDGAFQIGRKRPCARWS